jgi:hypothetical protein
MNEQNTFLLESLIRCVHQLSVAIDNQTTTTAQLIVSIAKLIESYGGDELPQAVYLDGTPIKNDI